MDKERFISRFNFITNIIILFFLVFGGIVWADTNGIWHRAEDVMPGVFGGDEGAGDFTFPGNVNVVGNVNVQNVNAQAICLNGVCYTSWGGMLASQSLCLDNKAVLGFDASGNKVCGHPVAIYG